MVPCEEKFAARLPGGTFSGDCRQMGKEEGV
jgi:hypothetical protein